MSGDRYRFTDQNAMHFTTFTVVGWMDVFTRKEQDDRGRRIELPCREQRPRRSCPGDHEQPRPPHHQGPRGVRLSDIIRDFKRHTANAIIKGILHQPESRRERLLARLFAQLTGLAQADTELAELARKLAGALAPEQQKAVDAQLRLLLELAGRK